MWRDRCVAVNSNLNSNLNFTVDSGIGSGEKQNSLNEEASRAGIFAMSVVPSNGPREISVGPERALCEQASYCRPRVWT